MNRKAIIIVAGVIAAGVLVFVLASGPGGRSNTTTPGTWTVNFTITGAVSPTVTYTMPKSNAAAASPTNPPAK